MRRLVFVGAVVTVGGCSLFGFDGFSGGEVASEAGADQSAFDAAGPNTDGAETTDAGGDTAPSGPFCKTTGAGAALCDDFEEPGTFTGKWPEKDSYLGALEPLDDIGFGGSRGLRFKATPRNDGQVGASARVILGYTSPTVASQVDCEVAVKPTTIPPGTYLAGPMYVQFDRPEGGRQSLGFYLDENRVLVLNPIVYGSDGSVVVGSGRKEISTLPLNEWSRVRLVANAGASPPSAFVYVDGALQHEQTMNGFAPAKVEVRIGANYANGTSSEIVFDLDDARIDWK